MRVVRISPAGFRVSSVLLVAVSLFFMLASVNAQGRKTTGNTPAPPSEGDSPSGFHEYRGIQLGMIADEVRKKLGDPKDKGDEQDFYMFGETEMAQIVYDAAHKVVTISADFLNSPSALTAKQVFGTEVEAKADGSVYKMVRYPKAGYWLSYNRSRGDAPMTTITLQKIQ